MPVNRLKRKRKVIPLPDDIRLPGTEARLKQAGDKPKPWTEWTSLLSTAEWRKALELGDQEALGLDATIDGEGTFIFKQGWKMRGRFHAALCFESKFYAVTFRSLTVLEFARLGRGAGN